MSYRVEISSVAEAEVDGAFLRLSQIISSEKTRQWYQGLLKAIESLSEMPKRSPLARENKYFSKEIRQFLYGRGRNTYRILHAIVRQLQLMQSNCSEHLLETMDKAINFLQAIVMHHAHPHYSTLVL